MTSKERVLAAFAHQKPDRIPRHYFGNSGINERLMKHFKAKDYQDIEENNKRIEAKKEDLKKLIAEVDSRDKDVIDFFLEAFKKSINSPKLISDKIFDALSAISPDLFVKARNYYLNFLNN